MSAELTNNFFAHARGLTFADANGVTWAFDPTTNKLTASYSGAGSSAANPTAKVGLSVVNGTAATFMRSDGAPPIDQTIAPTWTGVHTFSGASTSIKITGITGTWGIELSSASGKLAGVSLASNGATPGSNSTDLYSDASGNAHLRNTVSGGTFDFSTNGHLVLSFSSAGAATFSGTWAINGGTPTAPLSGFGSPSGTVTSGLTSSATLAQTAGTLAALLAYLKTIGVIAA